MVTLKKSTEAEQVANLVYHYNNFFALPYFVFVVGYQLFITIFTGKKLR